MDILDQLIENFFIKMECMYDLPTPSARQELQDDLRTILNRHESRMEDIVAIERKL